MTVGTNHRVHFKPCGIINHSSHISILNFLLSAISIEEIKFFVFIIFRLNLYETEIKYEPKNIQNENLKTKSLIFPAGTAYDTKFKIKK